MKILNVSPLAIIGGKIGIVKLKSRKKQYVTFCCCKVKQTKLQATTIKIKEELQLYHQINTFTKQIC